VRACVRACVDGGCLRSCTRILAVSAVSSGQCFHFQINAASSGKLINVRRYLTIIFHAQFLFGLVLSIEH
jgi:hypothetical protein